MAELCEATCASLKACDSNDTCSSALEPCIMWGSNSLLFCAAMSTGLGKHDVSVQIVRRIDVPVREVMWAESGELVTIVSESSFYVLRYDRSAVEAFAETGEELPEDGIEDAFELLNEVAETVRTGGKHPHGLAFRLPSSQLRVRPFAMHHDHWNARVVTWHLIWHCAWASNQTITLFCFRKADMAMRTGGGFKLHESSNHPPYPVHVHPCAWQVCGLETVSSTTTAPGGSTTALEGR